LILEFWYLLETTTQASLDHWVLRGVRSVLPAAGALKARNPICLAQSEIGAPGPACEEEKQEQCDGEAVQSAENSPPT